MTRRAVALFSGGLDSMLAVRILQRQDFAVHALYVRALYACGHHSAAESATRLGIPLTEVAVADDYLDLLRRPRFGYGKGFNPCVDCRIHMCRLAKRLMEQIDAQLVITGEVLGQRPRNQRHWDLDVIAEHSGLEGRLLRPLSAQRLTPTLVERQGLVDRSKLYAFWGQSRREMLALARELGIDDPPAPSTGCSLARDDFATQVRDLLHRLPDARRWDLELLALGRHTRFDDGSLLILGRNAQESAALADMAARHDARPCVLIEPDDFRGPTAILVGRASPGTLARAADAIRERSRLDPAQPARVKVRLPDGSTKAVDLAEVPQLLAGK